MRWPQLVIPSIFPRSNDRKYAEQHSAIVPVAIRWAAPPQVVNYGDTWNIGKDPRHAWPHRHLFRTDNSASALSIMQLPDQPKFPVIPSAMVARPATFAPHQAQNPVRGAVSIKTPKTGTWGAQRELYPLVGYDPTYQKLL